MIKLHLSLFAKIALSLVLLFSSAIITSAYFIVINQTNNLLNEKDKLANASAKSLAEGSIDALISRDYEFLNGWLHAVVAKDIYAYGFLSDTNGHILVHNDIDKIATFTEIPSPTFKMSSRYLNYKQRPVKEIIYVSGIGDEVFAYAHIAYYTDLSVFLVFKNVNIYILFLLMFFFLSIILLATLYIIRMHTRPISELSLSIQQFSFDNNIKIPNSIIERPDEIGLLASSFVQLMSRLNEAYCELKNEEKNLQTKVEQRTMDLKQQNNLLLKMQDQLVQSEKMASLGGLVAGVAHEINTPIGICLTAVTYLKGISQELQTQYQNNTMSENDLLDYLKTSQESCDIAHDNIDRAVQIISNFKKVAVDQHNDEKICFNLYQKLLELIKVLIPNVKRKQLNVLIEGDQNIQINSYQSVFYQIFSNLIINSLIHGFDSMSTGQIKIKFDVLDSELRLDYFDDGLGISEELIDKIFDPFVTTKRGQGGSGLGTHIVYNLVVQKLNGSISCTSKIDHGVHFKIMFPVETCE